MYCNYWNLNKAPFDNVPDPSMYTDCHKSMENVIAETVSAIKEANEAFAVIIGAAGLGKTLALRMIIDALERDRFKIVNINNPDVSFTQLLKDIIARLMDAPCEENRKAVLLETFRFLLEKTVAQGMKVVIFIDEANTISPANLENLRLLTNIQDDRENLFSLVLAGQMQLAQRLEHPKRTNLFQRIGSYSRIDKLPSEEALKTYIEDRLQLAGTMIKIFSDESIPLIWEFSEQGIPRLVNKICKLCLKIGETNHLDYISADIVSQTVQRFQKLSKTAVQNRRLRSRPDNSEVSDAVAEEMTVSSEAVPGSDIQTPDVLTITEITPEQKLEPCPAANIDESESLRNVLPPEIPAADESLIGQAGLVSVTESDIIQEDSSSRYEAKELLSTTGHPVREIISERPDVSSSLQEHLSETHFTGKADFQDASNLHDKYTSMILTNPPAEDTAAPSDVKDELPQGHVETSTPCQNADEMIIGEHKIQLAIPEDILKKVKSFNRESANKSAGFWAAQIIKKNPQLTSSPMADPVYIWNEIKDNILKRISM